MNQKQLIMRYVKRRKFITRMDAMSIGCLNLWCRIFDLEQEGARFDRRIVKTRNGKRVMQYWLVRGPK